MKRTGFRGACRRESCCFIALCSTDYSLVAMPTAATVWEGGSHCATHRGTCRMCPIMSADLPARRRGPVLDARRSPKSKAASGVVALFLLAVVTRAGAQTYDSLSYLAHEVDSVKHFEQWTQRLVHLCVPDGGLLELKLVRARMAPPKEDLFVIGATYRAPPEAVPPATAGHLIVLVDGASATLATPFGP